MRLSNRLIVLVLISAMVFAAAACAKQDPGENTVTISEDSEDAVVLENPDYIGTLTINTEGLGWIGYAEGDTRPEINEDYPAQSASVNMVEAATYTIIAKPEEGWRFVKWIKDGEDYSEDEIITVEVSESTEFIAVFDLSE